VVFRAVADTFSNWLRWGLALRRANRRAEGRRIYRVFDPFYLDEEVLRLVLPLFAEFRDASGQASPHH
jgi:hypothetical protein